MRYLLIDRPRPWQMALPVLALALVLAVACGSAAPAAPQESQTTDTSAPPPTAAAQATAAPTSVAQPAPASQEAAVHPGKVTIMVGDWETGRMSPLFAVSHNYGMILHGFLVSTNEKRELIPGIATNWEVSGDGKTWTFTIRDGVKFHDGQPVTAEDVHFTWLYNWGPGALEKTTSSTIQQHARNTVKIEQVDSKNVSITTEIVDASIPFFLSDAVGSVQGIVMPRWELDQIHNEEKILAYDRNPIGAGIMKLVNHVPEEVMEFERFDDYYEVERRVNFRSLDLRQVPEEATRVAALRAGEADIAPISLATKEQVESGGGRLVFGPEGTYLYARFREPWITDTPISKKEVRQALAYALDLKVFQEELFGPEVYVPQGWTHVTPQFSRLQSGTGPLSLRPGEGQRTAGPGRLS